MLQVTLHALVIAMEFGRHLSKGIWAFGDKGLPALFGIGMIFLVVRILPENEYGSFVLVQTLYTLASTLGTALALLPLTKFAAETTENGPYITAALTLLALFFAAVSVVVIALQTPLIALLDPRNEGHLSSLMLFIPVLLLTAYFRNFAVALLQATYRVREIFWIDAVYFLGSLVFFAAAKRMNHFSTASDVFVSITLAQILSSLTALACTRRQITGIRLPAISAIRTLWDFGKYSFCTTGLSAVFSQMDVFLLSSLVGVGAVAVYNAARILTRAFDMMTQLIMMFLLPFSSRHYAAGNIQTLSSTAEKTICFTTIVLLPVAFIMIAFPGEILHLLYGQRYAEGAPIVRILGFVVFVVPWTAVSSSFVGGIGRVKEALFFGVGLVVVSGIVYPLCITGFQAAGAALAFVAVSTLFGVSVTVYVQRFVPISVRGTYLRVRDIRTFALGQWHDLIDRF